MKAFYLALIAIGAIAYGADQALHRIGGWSTAEQASQPSSVRLGD